MASLVLALPQITKLFDFRVLLKLRTNRPESREITQNCTPNRFFNAIQGSQRARPVLTGPALTRHLASLAGSADISLTFRTCLHISRKHCKARRNSARQNLQKYTTCANSASSTNIANIAKLRDALSRQVLSEQVARNTKDGGSAGNLLCTLHSQSTQRRARPALAGPALTRKLAKFVRVCTFGKFREFLSTLLNYAELCVFRKPPKFREFR